MLIRRFDTVDYWPCWQAMKTFSDQRGSEADDELWLLEHPPVFTQGQAGKAEHVLAAGDIPVVQTDRGGQVTYHGPGQTVVYVLFDLKRLNLGTRLLVSGIEQAIIDMLKAQGIDAERHDNAPGVYVGDAKIASLGLRIRKGCSYHGLSLNRDLDLSVYQRINPCGYAGQPVTSLAALGCTLSRQETGSALLAALAGQFGLSAEHAGDPPDWYNPLASHWQDGQ